MAPAQSSLEFGEPLLFQLAVQLFFEGAEGSAINLHPIGWAAWFGMLATSFNLLPVGQLDGGHIVYALFGKKVHKIVSYATFGGLIGFGILSWPGYLVFALVLIFLRLRHPSPFVDLPVIGPGRAMLALLALVIIVLTFIPVPVRVVEHVGVM
jgi:membrane-associated protease RseP (regulator of RpoE activity)